MNFGAVPLDLYLVYLCSHHAYSSHSIENFLCVFQDVAQSWHHRCSLGLAVQRRKEKTFVFGFVFLLHRGRSFFFLTFVVVQLPSHVWLCSPMDCSTPGFPVPHHLPEFAQVHVQWIGDAIPNISSSVALFSSCPQSFPASGSFPVSQLVLSGGQSIRASASASVLPKNCCCGVAKSYPTLCYPMDCIQPTRLLCPWDFLSKNTGMDCHFLLQGIFLTKGLNLSLLHCRQMLYHWATWEAPSKEYSGLISFKIDWFDLLAVQGTFKSLLQHHSLKASILWCSAFFITTNHGKFLKRGEY